MQNNTQTRYLYSYMPEGHILSAHENEYTDEYDLDYGDEIDDEEFNELDDVMDEMH